MRIKPDNCKDGEIIDYSPSFNSKIKQIDKNGIVVKIWKSPSEAAKALNFDNSGIIKCAKGKSSSYKGFYWKYTSSTEPIIISKEKQQEIIDYFLTNSISIKNIAKHFNIGIVAIEKILKGLKREKIQKGNIKIDKIKYEDIKNMYLNLSAICEIAVKYSVSDNTILNILHNCGIKIRTITENNLLMKKKQVREYFNKTKSVNKCIEKFKTSRYSRFDIVEMISDKLIINDELIITIFYNKTVINFTAINHYFKNNNLTNFEKDIIKYINNRFNDSESTKETLYRIFYKKFDKPLCAECKKNSVHFTENKFVFTKFCSKKCSRNNKDTINNYHKTLKDNYGSENYNNQKQSQQTCINRYGKPNVFATDWCKQKIEDYWINNYGVKNPNQVEEIKNKHNFKELCQKGIETKRKNKTFNTSKPEEEAYHILIDKFGIEDVERQYNKDNRYPFQCDFYIKSLDMFIEYNGHWTHGKHPFNPYSKEDIETVNKWKSRCEKNEFYKVALNVWTKYDVKKRNFALKSKIKYIELWNMDDVKNFVK